MCWETFETSEEVTEHAKKAHNENTDQINLRKGMEESKKYSTREKKGPEVSEQEEISLKISPLCSEIAVPKRKDPTK